MYSREIKMQEIDKRKSWMSVLATSDKNNILSFWEKTKIKVNYQWLRPPEIGSIMAQGRMGVTGNKFNIGEVTITRCSLKLDCGTIGHSYVQGRSKKKAEIICKKHPYNKLVKVYRLPQLKTKTNYNILGFYEGSELSYLSKYLSNFFS